MTAPPVPVQTTAVVDVGIPTLGNSPYLVETIESVLAQTLASWTLTISENGPGTERMQRTLEPYLEDPRVHHIVTGTKVGRGENHNILVRSGEAPYVGLVHDDDRWHPGFLERRVAFLEEHRTCGFVFAGNVVIDESGTPVGRTKRKLPEGVHRSESILPKLYRQNFIGCPTVLVRRTAYEALSTGYKDILNYDIPMWLRLAARFDVGCLAVWDADYRHHPLQVSSRRTALAQERFPVLDEVADLPVPDSLKRLVRAEVHTQCALDAAERGDRRESIAHLGQAVRSDPLVVARPRVAARILLDLGVLATGDRGRRALTEARERRSHSGGLDELGPVTETSIGDRAPA